MSYVSPISIQFIWHPDDYEVVKPIVEYCKSNLSRDVNNPFLHSLDFPVFCYTSLTGENVPSDINTMSEKIIVFAFIGDSIVASDNWEAYIQKQYNNDRVKLIPIALSKNAFKLDGISEVNALRYWDYKGKYSDEKKLKQSFFIAISHEIYRWILKSDENHRQLKLFISHTKKDTNGLKLAQQLKSFIDNDTNMDNFFDTNDIQIGNEFDDDIFNNISESTLILIHSDTYSSRYWCQKEIIYAKKSSRPIISVDYINSVEDRSFPLMCNFPSIRYNENPLEILELALLETIRFYYCSALFAAYKAGEFIPKDSVVFNSVPDGFAINNTESNIIVYPEPEMYPEEKEIIANGKTLTTPLSYNLMALSGKCIGLSLSDISDNELVMLGQDISHLKSLSQMLAQKFLRNGAILIYGGDLRNDNYTRILFDEAVIVQDRSKKNDILIKDFIAWPIHLLESPELKNWSADYKGVCKIEKIFQPSDIECILESNIPVRPNSPENRYAWSRCLTFMREKMIAECDVRISAGGRITGYKGCMPGVLEEIQITLDKKKPLYILGGFGGISAKICQYLITGELPDELTLSWHKENNKNYSDLLQEYNDHRLSIDYLWLNKLNTNLLNNGLSEEDNLKLFTTPFVDEVIYLISKGLRCLFSDN